MFKFHIYLGDTCIGDVIAKNADDALRIYAIRTGTSTFGLTPICVDHIVSNHPVRDSILSRL